MGKPMDTFTSRRGRWCSTGMSMLVSGSTTAKPAVSVTASSSWRKAMSCECRSNP